MKLDLHEISFVAAGCFVFHETNGNWAGWAFLIAAMLATVVNRVNLK